MLVGFPVGLRDEGVSPQAKWNEKMRTFPTYMQGFHCELHVHEIKVGLLPDTYNLSALVTDAPC